MTEKRPWSKLLCCTPLALSVTFTDTEHGTVCAYLIWGSKGDRTKDMIQQITAGQIYKSLSDNDWGIKVIEIEPHGKKALVEYVSCGCPADVPKLGQRRVFLTEYIEKSFPIEYDPEPN